MHKFLMMLIVACISTPAAAEWTMIQTSDSGNMYIDFDSIQKSGDSISVSTLNDYYELQPKQELSSQWRELYDCKHKKFKILAVNYYAENMAKGNIVDASNLNEADIAWSDTVMYSIGELKTNLICSR
ncbi:MAG: hypothetical protein Q7T58_04630 [Methylotenera sp.]|nr:hypothetical protein [Methylotenera sp.]